MAGMNDWSWSRFQSQFRETEYERNARLRKARLARQAKRSACDVCGATDRPTATVVAYGIETNACDKCRGIKCEECGINYADPPSKLCPGCEAYRGHQR